MPKWAWWIILVIAAVLIYRNPAGAGHTVGQAVHAMTTFLGSL
jgi:hypothetical protein